ncbi:hypothetical protein ACHAWC_010351 [Mediolabrus comicus]
MSTNAKATATRSNRFPPNENSKKGETPKSPPSLRAAKNFSSGAATAAAIAAYGNGHSVGTPKRKPAGGNVTSPRNGGKKKQSKTEGVNQTGSGGTNIQKETTGKKSTGKDFSQASSGSNSQKDKGSQSAGKAKGSGTFVFGGTATSKGSTTSTIRVKGATLNITGGKKTTSKDDGAIDLTKEETSSDSSSCSSSSSGSGSSSNSSDSDKSSQKGGYESTKYGSGKKSSKGMAVASKTDNQMNQDEVDEFDDYDEEVEKDWNKMEVDFENEQGWKSEETGSEVEGDETEENVNLSRNVSNDKAEGVSSVLGTSSSKKGKTPGVGSTNSQSLRWGESTENVFHPAATPSGKKTPSEVIYTTPKNIGRIQDPYSPFSARPGEMDYHTEEDFQEVPNSSTPSVREIILPEVPASENSNGVYADFSYKMNYPESGGKTLSSQQTELLKTQRNEKVREALSALQFIAPSARLLPVIGNQDMVYDDAKYTLTSSQAPVFLSSNKNWVFYTDASKTENKSPDKGRKPRHNKKRKEKQTEQESIEKQPVWYNATFRLKSDQCERWLIEAAQNLLKEAGISLRVNKTQEIHTECKAIVCGLKTDSGISRAAIEDHICDMIAHAERALFRNTGRHSTYCRYDEDGNVIQAPLPNVYILQADPPNTRASKSNPSPPPNYSDERLAENGQVFHIIAGLSGWQRLLPLIQQFEKNNYFENFLGRKAFFLILDRNQSKSEKQQYKVRKMLNLHAKFQYTNDSVIVEDLVAPTVRVALHTADGKRADEHRSISMLSLLTSTMLQVPWYYENQGGAPHLANQIISELDPESPNANSSSIVFPGEHVGHQRCMANLSKYGREWTYCYMTEVCNYSQKTALSLIKRAFLPRDHLDVDLEIGIRRWDHETLTVDVEEQQLRTENDIVREYAEEGIQVFDGLTSSREQLDAEEQVFRDRAALCRFSDNRLSSDESVNRDAQSIDHYSAATGISDTNTVNTSNTNAFTDQRKAKYAEMKRENANMKAEQANIAAEKATIEAKNEELARELKEMKAKMEALKQSRSEESSISSEEKEDGEDSDENMSSKSSSDSDSDNASNAGYPCSKDTNIFDVEAYDKASRRQDSPSPSNGNKPSDGEEESVAS